jgi:hypothetical protein
MENNEQEIPKGQTREEIAQHEKSLRIFYYFCINLMNIKSQ